MLPGPIQRENNKHLSLFITIYNFFIHLKIEQIDAAGCSSSSATDAVKATEKLFFPRTDLGEDQQREAVKEDGFVRQSPYLLIDAVYYMIDATLLCISYTILSLLCL